MDSKRTIELVGDEGVGKSALRSALLEEEWQPFRDATTNVAATPVFFEGTELILLDTPGNGIYLAK